MNKIDAAGRLIQWEIELGQLDIEYWPQEAINYWKNTCLYRIQNICSKKLTNLHHLQLLTCIM